MLFEGGIHKTPKEHLLDMHMCHCVRNRFEILRCSMLKLMKEKDVCIRMVGGEVLKERCSRYERV